MKVDWPKLRRGKLHHLELSLRIGTRSRLVCHEWRLPYDHLVEDDTNRPPVTCLTVPRVWFSGLPLRQHLGGNVVGGAHHRVCLAPEIVLQLWLYVHDRAIMLVVCILLYFTVFLGCKCFSVPLVKSPTFERFHPSGINGGTRAGSFLQVKGSWVHRILTTMASMPSKF